MSETVIKVEGLSKSYILGHQSSEKYLALRDVIAARAKSVGKRILHPFKSSETGLITADETEEFWALRDVSFEIKQGDRVGIIGRNGAGKSTLLKVLSRITEPTKGRVEIEGRVASLLEVGTGFHQELTGRENIFLNGAILGMSKVDIKRKFDEIVAFAEVEKFLDTPVKRYSSGMYVRLAFAVAAHLEPEILVVDEVLAVGDAQFQKKCLGKMEEVGSEGRTVLFVSHNMSAITTLCDRAVLLNGGKISSVGTTQEVLNHYKQENKKIAINENSFLKSGGRRGSGAVRFDGIEIKNSLGEVCDNFCVGEKISIEFSCKRSLKVDDLRFLLLFMSVGSGEIISSIVFSLQSNWVQSLDRYVIVVNVDTCKLRPSEYELYFLLGDQKGIAYDVIDRLLPSINIFSGKERPVLFSQNELKGYFDLDVEVGVKSR